MKKSFIVLTAATVILASCQTKTTEETIDSLAKLPDTTAADGKSCYIYINNRDTVSLSFTKAGNSIAGELSNNLFEKDKNSGHINGVIRGDTIIADYTAQGEGVTSVRQVAFLKKGDQLLQGYGDTKDEGGKMVFMDEHKLAFINALALTATDCK